MFDLRSFSWCLMMGSFFSLQTTFVPSAEAGVTPATVANPSPHPIAAYRSEGAVKVHQVDLSPAQPLAHERVELRVELSAEYTNPFDATQVRLDGHFVSPSGKTYEIPGFFLLGFDRPDLENPRDHATDELVRNKEDGWRVRYQPQEAGEHTFWLTLSNGGETIQTEKQAFDVEAQDIRAARGRFIQLSEENPLVFAYDDGEPFVPVGMNVAFPDWGGSNFYDHYWEQLSAHGGNFARIWLAPTFKELCLVRRHEEDYPTAGLGYIDQEAAWRVDHLLEKARQEDLHVMLCMKSFNSLRTETSWPAWDENPHNREVGGFLDEPQAYFADETARALFKNRLRYTVARWGYSPTVFAWELWNEVDMVDHFFDVLDDVVEWHDVMARYLHEIDPYQHLVTTSTSTPGSIAYYGATRLGYDALDRLESLDFGQVHPYSYEEVAQTLSTALELRVKKYDKPQIVGEFSSGTMGAAGGDTEGANLHAGLWAGLMTSTPATAMTWWWDSYVDEYDLYGKFAVVADFMEGIDPANHDVRLIGHDYQATLIEPSEIAAEQPLHVRGIWAQWEPGHGNQPTEFEVLANRSLRGFEDLSCLLFPVRETELHNPVTFKVNYATDGEFVVHVNKISTYGGAGLKVLVDGEVALQRSFVPAEGESSDNVERHEGAYRIPIAAGDREVQVINDGESWMFADYELIGVYGPQQPWYHVQGLVFADPAPDHAVAIGWIQNRNWTWKRDVAGEHVEPVPAGELTLKGMPTGEFRVQWWDTETGDHEITEHIHVVDGRGTLSVPQVERDVAFRVLPQDTAPDSDE